MRWYIVLLLVFIGGSAFAQTSGPTMDPAHASEYEIGGITVSGTVTTDPNAVKLFTGLQVGDKVTVPGERITNAIRQLWDQQLFSDVRIDAAEIRGRVIFLNIIVVEKPRLSRFKFKGPNKSEADKLREEIQLVRGQQVNDALIANASNAIERYYIDKGFLKASVNIIQINDTVKTAPENSVLLILEVEKNKKVKIKDVVFTGNNNIKSRKLRKAMKKTRQKRWWNFFGSSKFLWSEYRNDKNSVLDLYNEKGYRNAAIVSDTMYFVREKRVRVEIAMDEGPEFRFRNITYTGNSKHSDAQLAEIMNINKGDIYNKKLLDSRLYMNQAGRDISSLYMDDGYLAFYPDPIELLVPGDSIDIDIRIREGKQYRIRNVIIKGNTKTTEHVIRREIYTKPGQLFNRSDVIRTQRELSTLGYFNPESMGVNPIQDARTGTVDLEYTVEEKPSDRLELSGGWGAGRVVLSLGLSFTNFSMRNLFKGSAWTPLPSGDGQTLNLRAQTNGRFFQSYSLSFVEPWLGGRKPNALSISAYRSVQTNGENRFIDTEDGRIANPLRQSLIITGVTLGIGKRLQWPDNYFILRQTLGYQLYDLKNYSSGAVVFSFTNGVSNVLSYTLQLSRSSIDQPFFSRTGSNTTISVKATPPYSLFQPERDWADLEPEQRYEWAEFHKWKFSTQWFNKLTNPKSGRSLVLMTRAGFGFLGRYNSSLGDSPFERFYLGGSALTGFQLDGREILGLRGYDDFSLAPNTGNFVVAKYTAELRYPISLNPSATIFTLAFLEAGNSYGSFNDFDPFKLYRSAGIGLRLNLPMFGPMGLDYGWRLDDVPNLPSMAKSQFHFTIGIDLGEL
ncbi:MAG: outer membrane protein assembly factor BamA [Flavobacteriales bacterium]|nr:outer membrane protein assembly factor BamA [Flavobacteriales bacterium]MBK7240072.1 outer membrane protein assembly factor BamA [Flavobacteriales bacterium]MBK9535606.1 outer membrane protein assembly factor BamA [Flavobacteriales bacterium]MBP9138690.1 outer membrane protein assembly factor BamA [Flavobacteriales bacterium]HQV50947.1 outer membrane protein assembly factor BamA [Flavobacteriales bacterium]